MKRKAHDDDGVDDNSLISEMVFDILNGSNVCSEMTFTDDARLVLVRGTVEYANDVFYEVGEAQRNLGERIEGIEERLRVLRAEMAELEDEKRETRVVKTMTIDCIHRAVERVAERGRAFEKERITRDEERDRRAVEPPRLSKKQKL